MGLKDTVPKDEIVELAEEAGQPLEKDARKEEPHPLKDHSSVAPDHPAGTGEAP